VKLYTYRLITANTTANGLNSPRLALCCCMQSGMQIAKIFDSILSAHCTTTRHITTRHNSRDRHNNKKEISKKMLNDYADGELIKRYLTDADDSAFEILLERHYDLTYKRFLHRCRIPDDAADLTQQLWMQVLKNLENYQDFGKFPAFLMRSASNLLTDYWRRNGVKDNVINDAPSLQGQDSDQNYDYIENATEPGPDIDTKLALQAQIKYLTQTLIPTLPCEQRLAFLLKHESEYWEYKSRLSWQHLAELNGMSEQDAWGKFETVRNHLVTRENGGKTKTACTCESMLIFLVWTQAQRRLKNQDFTWQYYAKILNISENTLKTRYRAALKNLSQGLADLEQHGEITNQ